MKQLWVSLKRWWKGLSFRTGVIMLLIALLCYVVSFAQMLFSISATMKGTLFIVFFGLAKVAQYAGLMITGTEVIRHFKTWRHRRRGE